MRRDPAVEIAPSTVRGKVHRGHLIPWRHRRTGATTRHVEVLAA